MIRLVTALEKDRDLLWNINQKYLYEMTNYYDDTMDENGNYHYGHFDEYFSDSKRTAYCQRPAILSSRSERILSVRDKVKCQGRKKETDTTGRKCQFQKKRAEAPGKNPRGAQVASQRSPILRRGQKPVN